MTSGSWRLIDVMSDQFSASYLSTMDINNKTAFLHCNNLLCLYGPYMMFLFSTHREFMKDQAGCIDDSDGMSKIQSVINILRQG